MHRKYSYFSFSTSKLHYSVHGDGDKVLLMFHGFGQTHKAMRGVEEVLLHEYKVYNFDLFFHGFSEWNDKDSPLTPEFLQKMFTAFFKEQAIHSFGIVGFSLGAKVALTLVPLFPKMVDSLFLIAPDGIHSNFWYNLITSKPLKGLFRRTITHPAFFHSLANFLGKFRFLDKSTLRFASLQMNSREKRRRVYYSWTVFKGLQPNLLNVAASLNANSTPTHVFIGLYDRIVRYEDIKTFMDKVKGAKLYELNSGHNNLLDEVCVFLEKQMQRQ